LKELKVVKIENKKKMDFLYETAKEIEANSLWRPYLTDEEHNIFLDSLGDKDKWDQFINLNYEDKSENLNVLQIVGLRTRAMLYEKAIPSIFSLKERNVGGSQSLNLEEKKTMVLTNGNHSSR